MVEDKEKKDKLPKRVETKTLMRILSCLLHGGPQKRTNTSTHCNMSYSRFIPYMNYMVAIGAVLFADPTQILNITLVGKNLLEYLETNMEE